MAVETLRCRVCESEYPAVASGVCARCFGPLDPVYDWGSVAAAVTRERIEAGPHSLWRYAPLLPVDPPADAAAGPGFTPLVPAPRLAHALGVGEVLLKLDSTNPTHSFKDRVVAVAAAKAAELGIETLACASTGNLSVYGATLYGVRGSYDDCSRLAVELAGEVDWAFVNVNLRSYYAEGSKTLAFEIGEQLDWQTPDAVIAPVASGALFTKLWQGFEQFRRLELLDGPSPRIYGGQAEGCAPVATAYAEERRVSPVRPATAAQSLAIGDPADGDLAIATARASGGAIYAVPEEDVGPNMALLAELTGVFGETAAGVTLGALRAAVTRGEVGERDRVVVLVTGTGLKTPQLVSDAGSVIEIDPDVDVLLSELGVG